MKLTALLLALVVAVAVARSAEVRFGDQKINRITYTEKSQPPTRICMENSVSSSVRLQILSPDITNQREVDGVVDTTEDGNKCIDFATVSSPPADTQVTYIIGYEEENEEVDARDAQDVKDVRARATFTFKEAPDASLDCSGTVIYMTKDQSGCLNGAPDAPPEGSPCYTQTLSNGIGVDGCKQEEGFEYCQKIDTLQNGGNVKIASLEYENDLSGIKFNLNKAEDIKDAIVVEGKTKNPYYASVESSVATPTGLKPGTNTYTVCSVGSDQDQKFSQDVITDIDIQATILGDGTIADTKYYEFGFHYEDKALSNGKYRARVGEGSDESKVTIDCSGLEPPTRCFGYIQPVPDKKLQVSYLIDEQGDGTAPTEDNIVIFGEISVDE